MGLAEVSGRPAKPKTPTPPVERQPVAVRDIEVWASEAAACFVRSLIDPRNVGVGAGHVLAVVVAVLLLLLLVVVVVVAAAAAAVLVVWWRCCRLAVYAFILGVR